MREFNVTPDLEMVKTIKKAQIKGDINKPEIMSISDGSITAYNPLCLFNQELNKEITDCDDGISVLEVCPVTMTKNNTIIPNKFITVSLKHPAGDNMGLLNLMANVMERITRGEYGNYVSFTDVYVFTSYSTARFDGSLTGQLSVAQTDIAVLPINSDYIPLNMEESLFELKTMEENK